MCQSCSCLRGTKRALQVFFLYVLLVQLVVVDLNVPLKVTRADVMNWGVCSSWLAESFSIRKVQGCSPHSLHKILQHTVVHSYICFSFMWLASLQIWPEALHIHLLWAKLELCLCADLHKLQIFVWLMYRNVMPMKNVWTSFLKIYHLGHKMMVDSLSKVGFKTAVTLISTFTACPLEKVMLQITFSENQLQSKQDWWLFYGCLCFLFFLFFFYQISESKQLLSYVFLWMHVTISSTIQYVLYALACLVSFDRTWEYSFPI